MSTLYAADVITPGEEGVATPPTRNEPPPPSGGGSGGGSTPPEDVGTPDTPIIIAPDDKEPEIYSFDYAVLRYSWTSSNGRDLDTRTSVTVPPRNQEVGWSRTESDSDILIWVGDDTSDGGTEAILFNFKRLIELYPSLDSFEVLLKAFWYASISDGQFKLQFESYKGGTMVKSGYNWVNTGGVVAQSIILDCHVITQSNSNMPGDPVAKFIYDRVANSGRLVRL